MNKARKWTQRLDSGQSHSCLSGLAGSESKIQVRVRKYKKNGRTGSARSLIQRNGRGVYLWDVFKPGYGWRQTPSKIKLGIIMENKMWFDPEKSLKRDDDDSGWKNTRMQTRTDGDEASVVRSRTGTESPLVVYKTKWPSATVKTILQTYGDRAVIAKRKSEQATRGRLCSAPSAKQKTRWTCPSEMTLD